MNSCGMEAKISYTQTFYENTVKPVLYTFRIKQITEQPDKKQHNLNNSLMIV